MDWGRSVHSVWTEKWMSSGVEGSKVGIYSKFTEVRSLVSGGSVGQKYLKASDTIPWRFFYCNTWVTLPCLLTKEGTKSFSGVVFLWQESLGDEMKHIWNNFRTTYGTCSFMKQYCMIFNILTTVLQFLCHFKRMLSGSLNNLEDSSVSVYFHVDSWR